MKLTMRTFVLTRSLALVGFVKCATSGAFSMFPKRSLITSSFHLGTTAGCSSMLFEKRCQLQTLSHPLTTQNDFSVSTKVSYNGENELLVIPYGVDVKKTLSLPDFSSFPPTLSSIIEDMSNELRIRSQSEYIEAKQSEVFQLYPKFQQTKHVAFVKITTDNEPESEGVAFKKAASQLGKSIASIVADTKVESVGVVENSEFYSSKENLSEMLLGMHDFMYSDKRFKGTSSPLEQHKSPSLKKLQIISHHSMDQITVEAKRKADAIGGGVYFAKDVVGAPSNWKTPDRVANLAEEIGKEYGMQCKILGLEECQRLGMGAYLAVQQGSKFNPQFVHLHYKRADASLGNPLKIALIGKGLTFDSGGYNLKAGLGSMIELMKFDVGGCAAVLGSAVAIGELKPDNIEVHFISPLCENMISSEAMRPGDIVRASNGKTIEIINTDAEGRLALADALCYAESLHVDAIIDVATLTGACIVGLGEHVAGLYSNDVTLRKGLETSSSNTNELVWHLPLEKSYLKSIKSNIADLKNLASAKGGGSITAALYLQQFVKSTPWAHLDIAGPTWDYASNKPTGFGVKLLVDFVLNANNHLNK